MNRNEVTAAAADLAETIIRKTGRIFYCVYLLASGVREHLLESIDHIGE